MHSAQSFKIGRNVFAYAHGRVCSVGLQADTVDSSKCPPEGGRYTHSA
jgi:hypothetical protein